ncbi:MAG: bifunctional phosphopantothenoylcysteine decarboxylase/phosphopantothenate--cysteine ligase CoaBC, partial [Lachnospiraceae bacterium]|nr:bifunctional phosphopantothenoylcysteine decarboxylase/phosphopantothenate--cysteine ligase CoaBC [Lachnospiraceae bacterium]
GKKVLVTAGPTREAIDPVRFISNHSTGKMGYAIARVASRRGAEVTLISGPTNLDKPLGVRVIDVTSAGEMYDAVVANYKDADIIIKSAAVADYTPTTVANQKMKKSDDDMSIELTRTEDILAWLGQHKLDNQKLCGFAMETENLLENATAKLAKKNADMIVANSIATEGAGFGVDTNVATLITSDGAEPLDMMSKEELAAVILNRLN